MTNCVHMSTHVTRTTGFTGPVAYGDDENPAAHGCVRDDEVCDDCGATRAVNVNQRHVEEGPWSDEEVTRW